MFQSTRKHITQGEKNQASQREPLEIRNQKTKQKEKLHFSFTDLNILTVWCLMPSLQASVSFGISTILP